VRSKQKLTVFQLDVSFTALILDAWIEYNLDFARFHSAPSGNRNSPTLGTGGLVVNCTAIRR
jgi:hypothetical protein